MPHPFAKLPEDVVLRVLATLNDRDAAVVRGVSRRLQQIAYREYREQRIPRRIAERREHFRRAIPNLDPYEAGEYSRGLQLGEMMPAHRGSMSTGRSLLLNRNLRIPRFLDLHFARDNYLATLDLSDEMLTGLAGKRILDVGAGLSIFASEVAVLYGITVDRVDLNAANLTAANRRAVVVTYVECMALLLFLFNSAPGAINTVLHSPSAAAVIRRLEGRIADVVLHYERSVHMSPIQPLNITALGATVLDDTYDGVFCNWVMMYLTKVQQGAALAEMVRVTKVGGEIRVLPGDTLDGRHKMTRQFISEAATSGDKCVRFVKFELDGLAVLQVARTESTCRIACVIQ